MVFFETGGRFFCAAGAAILKFGLLKNHASTHSRLTMFEPAHDKVGKRLLDILWYASIQAPGLQTRRKERAWALFSVWLVELKHLLYTKMCICAKIGIVQGDPD